MPDILQRVTRPKSLLEYFQKSANHPSYCSRDGCILNPPKSVWALSNMELFVIRVSRAWEYLVQVSHGTCVDAKLLFGYADDQARLIFFGDTPAWVSKAWVDGIWDGIVWGLQATDSENNTKVLRVQCTI